MKRFQLFCYLVLSASFCFAQSVGIGTTTPNTNALLHIDLATSTSKGLLVTGTYNGVSTVPDLDGGSRMMFYPGKAAFRAGYVEGPEWWNANVGVYSTATGRSTIASGSYSTAMGNGTTASGRTSISMGDGTTASGDLSTVMGIGSKAKGYGSTVLGMFNDSILTADQGSATYNTPLFIIGNGNNYITRSNAMVVRKDGNVGIGNITPNDNALLHVGLEESTSKGFLVSGTFNDASIVPDLGTGSRMMFYPGKAAFRAGSVTGTLWNNSNVGKYSSAMGVQTNASGFASTAMGSTTTASGSNSTAMGIYTWARGYATTVVGISNEPISTVDETVITPTTPLFIIGNGEVLFNRSNAMVVRKDGNIGMGTNSPSARLHLKSNSSGNATNSQLLLEEDGDDYTRLTMKNTITPSRYWDMGAYSHTTNSSARLNFFYQGVGDILSLKGDGNATLSGILTQLSDKSLKKDIVPIENALEKLTQLNGYNYYWSDENKDQSLQTGVLAQEVQKEFPELVSKNEKGILSVNYSGIIPVLIQSTKEQQKQIEILKKDNLDLKARLDNLQKILVNN